MPSLESRCECVSVRKGGRGRGQNPEKEKGDVPANEAMVPLERAIVGQQFEGGEK